MITKFHKIWISIFIVSSVIWFLWASQYITIANNKNRTLLDVNQNREILISLKENEKIKWKIHDLKDLLSNKQNSKSKNDFVKKSYEKLLKDLAKTDIDWEWLILTLSWDIDISSLIDLVHTLWFANAKAISINNIRINSNSYFSLINDNIILLNWEPLSSPMIFSIVWEQSELKKYLTQADWIQSKLKERWILTEAEFADILKISK